MFSEENAAEESNAQSDKALEQARADIERIMMQLPAAREGMHQQYLAGYIDCLQEKGHIPEEIRETLYAEYAF